MKLLTNISVALCLFALSLIAKYAVDPDIPYVSRPIEARPTPISAPTPTSEPADEPHDDLKNMIAKYRSMAMASESGEIEALNRLLSNAWNNDVRTTLRASILLGKLDSGRSLTRRDIAELRKIKRYANVLDEETLRNLVNKLNSAKRYSRPGLARELENIGYDLEDALRSGT